MATYFSELCRAMQILGERDDTIFLGQAVEYAGTGMTKSFDGVPRDKLLELPVFENTQLGMSIGLSLQGFLPISVFPRWNFLIAAACQLVNHLDKIPVYSAFKPRVLIRVASGSVSPLDPGPQHLGDFGPAFKLMLRTVRVVMMINTAMVFPSYYDALRRGGSTILVEYPALYEQELS
jgi:pyruvate/2-oxoglutarate/acetoin dehydrogenase E1 component